MESYKESFMNYTSGYQMRSDEREYYLDYRTLYRIFTEHGDVIMDGIEYESIAKNHLRELNRDAEYIEKTYLAMVDKIDKQTQKMMEEAAKWRDTRMKVLSDLENRKLTKNRKDLKGANMYLPDFM